MLEVENIVKKFQDKTVLNGISFSINSGEIYGLVGANGAGKTTVMNIICRLLNCDSGSIYIDGVKINRVEDLLGKIGFIMDIPSLYGYMTAYEYFAYLSSILKVKEQNAREHADNLLNLVGLTGIGNKRIKSFSRGMQQRLGIAVGLYNNPDIIILDEPTSALDPIGRYEISNVITSLKNIGKTVLLSTHILSDVEKVCDRIGFLVNGVIKKEGTIKEIFDEYFKPIYQIEPSRDIEKIYGLLQSKSYVKKIKSENDLIKVEIEDNDDSKIRLLNDISCTNVPINAFNIVKPSLEKIFLLEAQQ